MVIMNRGRGKMIRVKCLKCGHETHLFKDNNPNFDKQVDILTNTPCNGGRDIIGRPVEKCGGKRILDKRIIGER